MEKKSLSALFKPRTFNTIKQEPITDTFTICGKEGMPKKTGNPYRTRDERAGMWPEKGVPAWSDNEVK